MKVSQYLKKISGKKVNELLRAYLEKFGDGQAHLLRVPARINLLGTHIEHRGGYVNYLTIDKEMWCIAGEREDQKIVAYNLEGKYSPEEFEIRKEFPGKGVEWLDFIRKVKVVPGNWMNYVKAPISYLQNKFPDTLLKGMNLYFYGEIPVGAGLSSSSALVVATMLSACKISGLDIEQEKLVEMCGEAEWYVGTRGGSGDHAAMIFGRKNQIAHMRFFPFKLEYLPFPEDYQVICCNSLIEAKKSEQAKSIFNERIASYEIGFRLIRKNFPETQDKLVYLRDINPENLGSEKLVYEMISSLPESARRNEILKLLPEEKLETFFETHNEPENGYYLRNVIMYGVSECERTKKCANFLKKKKIEKFGELMYISHDGDRVVKFSPDGKMKKWQYRVDDKYLFELIEDLESSDSGKRQRARIYNQPGAYGCSTPELDFIVDLVKQIPTVKGAKLTGAGLGGCILILVEKESAEEVLEIVNEKYYRARDLPEVAFICNSVEGAKFV